MTWAYCPICDHVFTVDPEHIETFHPTNEPLTHILENTALVTFDNERAARMYKASQQITAEIAGQVKAL